MLFLIKNVYINRFPIDILRETTEKLWGRTPSKVAKEKKIENSLREHV